MQLAEHNAMIDAEAQRSAVGSRAPIVSTMKTRTSHSHHLQHLGLSCGKAVTQTRISTSQRGHQYTQRAPSASCHGSPPSPLEHSLLREVTRCPSPSTAPSYFNTEATCTQQAHSGAMAAERQGPTCAITSPLPSPPPPRPPSPPVPPAPPPRIFCT